MKLSIGFSPCPNDTFIFEALLNGDIETNGIEYEMILEDVETLNEWAMAGRLDITKISYGVLPLITKRYIVLDSGSALGNGAGPLLISKTKIPLSEISGCTIVLPGEHTTAHLLFALAFPKADKKIFKRYNQIEDFLLNNGSNNQAGVIIHENRFTYEDKGLHALMDLGTYWEEKTKSPIPLGGIVVKREIQNDIQIQIQNQIHQSIRVAWTRYPNISPFIKKYSQDRKSVV